MKLGYFPGCSMHSGAKDYGESIDAVAGPLGIELTEIRDWSCCGTTSAHATNHLLAIGLAARNLSLAEAQGLDRVVAPCSGCFSRLATARHEIGQDPGLAHKVGRMLDRPFKNGVDVLSALAVLRESIPQIKSKATRPLTGLKVACYYGCLLARPPELIARFDDPEAPTSMEEIAAATGAVPVAWNRRLDCCGAALSMPRTGSVVRLGRAILEDAKAHGAQAVVVACGLCHLNLDLRQKAMEARGALGIPVLYLTQLVGLSLEIAPEKLGLKRHFVSTDRFVQQASTPRAQATP